MLACVTELLSIGEFSRMTQVSASALRFYHELRLLPPAAVDPVTGYRRYSMDQVARAQLVRRLRDLDMPLETVRDVLEAPDVLSRDALLRAHLERMERKLERTRAVVSSLRTFLENPGVRTAVEY